MLYGVHLPRQTVVQQVQNNKYTQQIEPMEFERKQGREGDK